MVTPLPHPSCLPKTSFRGAYTVFVFPASLPSRRTLSPSSVSLSLPHSTPKDRGTPRPRQSTPASGCRHTSGVGALAHAETFGATWGLCCAARTSRCFFSDLRLVGPCKRGVISLACDNFLHPTQKEGQTRFLSPPECPPQGSSVYVEFPVPLRPFSVSARLRWVPVACSQRGLNHIPFPLSLMSKLS